MPAPRTARTMRQRHSGSTVRPARSMATGGNKLRKQTHVVWGLRLSGAHPGVTPARAIPSAIGERPGRAVQSAGGRGISCSRGSSAVRARMTNGSRHCGMNRARKRKAAIPSTGRAASDTISEEKTSWRDAPPKIMAAIRKLNVAQ